MVKSASMRLTASNAIGEIGGASCRAAHWWRCPPTRRTFAARGSSTKLRRSGRACGRQHRAGCSRRMRRPAERRRSRPNAAQDVRAFDRARHRTTPPEDPCRQTAGHRARRPIPGQFRLAFCEDGDRGVVAMQPLSGQHMPLDQRVQRLERRGAATWSASVDRLRSIPSRA